MRHDPTYLLVLAVIELHVAVALGYWAIGALLRGLS